MKNKTGTEMKGGKPLAWAAGGLLLVLVLWFSPLGRALAQWWQAQQDLRLYGESCRAWDAGRFEEAKSDCELILTHEPAFPGALVTLGKYYAEKSDPPDWEKAADYESRALAVQKDFPTLLAYGGSLWKLQKYGDSEKVLRDCLGQQPQNPEVYEQLGWVLVCQKQYEEASHVLAQGLQLDPGNRNMKGWRREALRRLSEKG